MEESNRDGKDGSPSPASSPTPPPPPGKEGNWEGERNDVVEVVEAEPEERREETGCCIKNLDNCFGDNLSGARDCCCCLGRATKEVYAGCRHLELKSSVKNTFTVNNVRRKFPITFWLPKYSVRALIGDIISGLTVGLIAVPQALAYAKLAGLPPEYGLYSLFMPCFAYMILGTAKDINLGPTAIMSLLTSELAASPIKGDPTFAIVLALMTGILQCLMGIFHLGFLVNYISNPIIHAYTFAFAVITSCSQIPHWFGLKDVPRDFIPQIVSICKKLPETRIADFALGLFCVIVLFLLKRMRTASCMMSKNSTTAMRCFRYFVWLLSIGGNAVVVLGCAGVAAILMYYGVQPFILTGYIPPGLPPFKAPAFTVSDGNNTYSVENVFTAFGTGLITAPVLSLVSALATAKTYAKLNKYKVEPNQEMIAAGVGNILGSFVSGFPVSGSISRSAVISQSGGMTPATGLWTGVLVLLVLAFITPVFQYIPDATLACVIIVSVTDVVTLTLVRKLWDLRKIELIPWFVTVIVSFLLGIDKGFLFGVAVSLCILLYAPAKPKMKEVCGEFMVQSDEKMTRIEYTVIEVNHGLTFPSAERFMKLVSRGLHDKDEESVLRSVIIDFNRITSIDCTIIQSLEALSIDFYHAGVRLIVCDVQPEILKVLLKADIKHLFCTSTREEALVLLSDGATQKGGNPFEITVVPMDHVGSEDDGFHQSSDSTNTGSLTDSSTCVSWESGISVSELDGVNEIIENAKL